MSGPRTVATILAAGLLGALLLPVSEAPVAADTSGRVVFSFADERIVESSGLVDLGASMVTTNDSGDSARVFVVDPTSGETIGVTHFGDDPVDVEALAPAGPDRVWVGDIGDNARTRPWIRVYRVPVSAGEVDVESPEAYYLNYPDGAHDAEGMVVDDDGNLLVVTKSAAGGKVYRAPRELSATTANVLELLGEVDEYVTDAALTADQRHLLLRSLGQASVYTYPDLELVTRFSLPSQRQGEGVSLGPRDRLRLSSEGQRTAVLEMELPVLGEAAAQEASEAPGQFAEPADPASDPASNPDSDPDSNPASNPDSNPDSDRPRWLLITIPSVIALGGLVIALVLRRSRK